LKALNEDQAFKHQKYQEEQAKILEVIERDRSSLKIQIQEL
jgi:hypothetical protein